MCVFIVLAVGAVYLPVINHSISGWDDGKYMLAVWKPGWERAWRILTDFDLRYSREVYYCPLHFLSLMLDQVFADPNIEPNPQIAKFVNVIFHAVNSLLVFSLILATGTGRRAAFMGALIYAVHPVQVGTVAWIAERKNLLVSLFYISALITFIRYLGGRSGRYLIATFFLFLGALLSKPSAVTLPAALLLLLLMFREKEYDRVPAVCLIAVLFSVAGLWGIYVLSTEVTNPIILPALPYRPLLAAGAVWFYLGKFVFPYHLVPIYPRWEVENNVIAFALLLSALLVAGGVTAYFWKRLDRWIQWGLLFFLLNLSLVSGLIPFGYMSHSHVSDHFLYLPIIGLSLIVARGLDLLFSGRGFESPKVRRLTIAVYLVIALLGVVAVRQTMLWRNPATVWEAVLDVNKTSVAALNNYGMLLLQKGEYDKALSQFERVMELAPAFDKGFINAAHAYRLSGRNEQAVEMYKKAMVMNKQDIWPPLMIARILWGEEKRAEAVDFLEKAVKGLPQSGHLRQVLGVAYYRSGREAEALEAFNKAIELEPLVSDAYVSKASLLFARGEIDAAIPLLERAIGLSTNAEAHNVLGAALAQKGEFSRALSQFLTAYKIEPDRPGVRDNVANLLMEANNFQAAEQFCSEAKKNGHPCSDETLKRLREGMGPAKK